MTFQLWLEAYLITQAIEVPIWLMSARHLKWPRRCLFAVGASTITHPILWWAIPWESWPYWPTVALGETFVVLAEALFARSLGVRNPLLWSLAANAASFGIGLILMAG